MSRVGVIVHERLGNWARQLRPRLAASPARVRETRSWPDLEAAIQGVAAPVAVFDLDRFGHVGLMHLDRLVERASDALVLVIDPTGDAEQGRIARELGATHVIAGMAPPQDVAALILRWVAVAHDRMKRAGYHRPIEADPRREPWAWLAQYGIDDTPGQGSIVTPQNGRLATATTIDPSGPKTPSPPLPSAI